MVNKEGYLRSRPNRRAWEQAGGGKQRSNTPVRRFITRKHKLGFIKDDTGRSEVDEFYHIATRTRLSDRLPPAEWNLASRAKDSNLRVTTRP